MIKRFALLCFNPSRVLGRLVTVEYQTANSVIAKFQSLKGIRPAGNWS